MKSLNSPRLFKVSLFFLFTAFFFTTCSPKTETAVFPDIVEVEGGKVQGFVEDSITVFLGIPFATPPEGELRWKAPQPAQPWDSVLLANHFAPACPQLNAPWQAVPGMTMSEDCLYLNVWTPARSVNDNLPVMVWIYGGGFSQGTTATPNYNGKRLAKEGVILVSIAYRLGPLGFLAHPELTAESENGVSGNYGLLDQIAGLKWVQKNIDVFGGDPGKVTIFGESAGGISVSMLCASSLTKSLFTGAICESGGSFGPVVHDTTYNHDVMRTLSDAEKAGEEFADRMGVQSIEELRKLEPSAWKDDPAQNMGVMWPIVDGYVITNDQYKLYREGKFNDVNVIIGTNSDEGGVFARSMQPEQYRNMISNRFGEFAGRILEMYPGSTEEETYTSSADIFRETAFAWPTWAWANLQSENGNSKVFVYYFDRQQPSPPDAPHKPRGAFHGAEIQYVFGHINLNQDNQHTGVDQKLSKIMVDYWTNFAKTGDPNGNGLPEWPEYTADNSRVQYLDEEIHSGPVPNLEKLKLMEEYYRWRRKDK